LLDMLASLAVGLVALAHVGFFVLESFLFSGPLGRRIFGLSEERAAVLAPMALNQGWYNAFLAAGLAWSLVHPSPVEGRALATFFLGCVVVAGVVGGLSVQRTILLVQALPAVVALALVWAR
jgi:putative membrane protein